MAPREAASGVGTATVAPANVVDLSVPATAGEDEVFEDPPFAGVVLAVVPGVAIGVTFGVVCGSFGPGLAPVVSVDGRFPCCDLVEVAEASGSLELESDTDDVGDGAGTGTTGASDAFTAVLVGEDVAGVVAGGRRSSGRGRGWRRRRRSCGRC